MFAAAFATMSALDVVFFRVHDKPLRTHVVVLGVEVILLGKATHVISHGVKIED